MRALAVALLAALALPATAHASRMSMFTDHGRLYFRYYGSEGEANQLSISEYAAGDAHCGKRGRACYFVADPAAAGNVNAGGDCFSEDSAYPGQGECDFRTAPVHMTIYLDDRNDSVSLRTSAADATIYGGPGNDTIATGGAGLLKLNGGPGDDTLAALRAQDRMEGAAGDDVLVEPPDCSRAAIDGGVGNDTVEASTSCAAGMTLDLRRLHGIENAVGSAGPDRIVGNAGPNKLDGGADDDTIGGGAGDDTIKGGPGDDTLGGGAGDDAIDGGDGDKDRLFGNAGNDTLTDNFGSLYGGDGNDTLTAGMTWTGFGPVNVLQGGAGDDTLRCMHVVCRAADGPGDDRVVGSTDRYGDTFFAGPGADTYDGNGGAPNGGGDPASACNEFMCFGYTQPDVITYRQSTRGVNVTLDGQANDGAPGEHDDVRDVGAVIGSGFADRLTAGSAPASLFGGAGADVLTGGPAGDDLVGGPGDDVLTGGAGADAFACGLDSDRVTDAQPNESETACAP